MNDPCFVMGDVKPGNFLVDQLDGQWAISGLFDFTNSYFADPLVDLTKMILFLSETRATYNCKRIYS